MAWLYKHDASLKIPYQDNLSALIHEPTFKAAVGEAIFSKARVIQRLGNVSDQEMWEVFNMGCGFVAVVEERSVDAAVAVLEKRHPGTRRIGTVTDQPGVCTAPGGVVLRG